MPKRRATEGERSSSIPACNHQGESVTREPATIMYNGQPTSVVYISYPCGYRRVDAAPTRYFF